MSGESLPSGVLKVAEECARLAEEFAEVYILARNVNAPICIAARSGLHAAIDRLAALASPPPQATGAQPHPEPSEEASSLLPVVGYAIRESDQFMWAPPVSRPFAKAWRAVVYEADAQSKLNAMRAERDAARVLAASHSNECEKWAAMHQRSKAEISDLKTDYECRLKKLCDHGMGLCDQIDALKAALKAAPVVDVEAIMRLAEKMMRDSWATGDDSSWHPARDELRAALASPEGSPR